MISSFIENYVPIYVDFLFMLLLVILFRWLFSRKSQKGQDPRDYFQLKLEQSQNEKYYKYLNQTKEIVIQNIQSIIRQETNKCNEKEWQEILDNMQKSVINLLEDNERFQIPLIMKQNHTIELTREQIFSFLSLMFFDLTISQEDGIKENKFNCYQNMYRLRNAKNELVQQKFKCIKAYFKIFYKFRDQLKDQKVRISKIKTDKNFEIQRWMDSEAPISDVEFINESMFEFKNKTFVDFADPFIGGLALDNQNCAQEEIIMLLHPEAIVAQLFFSKMEENEAIYFENVLRTCNFEGYEQTFKCIEINDDNLQIENILAIDAYYYQNEDQFEKQWVQRELNKAYVGFYGVTENNGGDIVSGKWGCGVYQGNVILKMLIQIASFSQSLWINNIPGKPPKLILSFFKDPYFNGQVHKIRQIITNSQTVGRLIKTIIKDKQKIM